MPEDMLPLSASRLAPAVVFAPALEREVDRHLARDESGEALNAMLCLHAFGRTCSALVASGPSGPRIVPHPTLEPLADWLAGGGGRTLSITIPPFRALIVRGVGDAVVKVVHVRELREPEEAAQNAGAEGDILDASDEEGWRLSDDLVMEMRAALQIASICDVAALDEAMQILAEVEVAIALVAERLQGHEARPGGYAKILMDEIHCRLIGQVGRFAVVGRTVSVTVEMKAQSDPERPFKVVEVLPH